MMKRCGLLMALCVMGAATGAAWGGAGTQSSADDPAAASARRARARECVDKALALEADAAQGVGKSVLREMAVQSGRRQLAETLVLLGDEAGAKREAGLEKDLSSRLSLDCAVAEDAAGLGKGDEAREWLAAATSVSEALGKDVDDFDWEILGETQAHLQDLPAALATAQKMRPQAPQGRLLAAIAVADVKGPAHAIAESRTLFDRVERVVENQPEGEIDRIDFTDLARYKQKAGDTEGAVRVLDREKNVGRRASLLAEIGLSCLDHGDAVNAKNLMEKAAGLLGQIPADAQHAGDRASVCLQLAEGLAKLGDEPGAEAMLAQARTIVDGEAEGMMHCLDVLWLIKAESEMGAAPAEGEVAQRLEILVTSAPQKDRVKRLWTIATTLGHHQDTVRAVAFARRALAQGSSNEADSAFDAASVAIAAVRVDGAKADLDWIEQTGGPEAAVEKFDTYAAAAWALAHPKKAAASP